MIDLMNNSLNGSNGNSDSIPCPACAELKTIRDILNDYSTFDNEAPSVSVDLLLSEVKMWRAKDVYERKLKSTLIASTIKKMQAEGLDINGDFNN